MNESKKLSLSKETLRCLDDEDLTDVVGGHCRGGGGNNNSFDCNNNSNVCSGVCVSFECNSIAIGLCL